MSPAIEIDDAWLLARPLPCPDSTADKDERGSILVIAGSAETPGAAWLGGVAALRAGAGKLCIATVASVAAGLAMRLPEARVIGLPESAEGGLAPAGLDRLDALLDTTAAILVGPGLRDEPASAAFVHRLLERAPRAGLVLDALGMSVVSLAGRFERAPLLTPHAGEMAHLSGLSKEEVAADSERVARDMAARWNGIVVLKGATTTIALPGGGALVHRGGNVGLATSGSGDVLAGLIAGLVARGMALEVAAAWGVALHARAGAALAFSRGPLGYLASELAAEVPALMAGLADRAAEGAPS